MPCEIQITLITHEIVEITELEKVLDIFQTIRDRELGRQQSRLVSQTNAIRHHSRGSTIAHRDTRGDYSRSEGWDCRIVNYTFRIACFRRGRARSCQRSEPVSNINDQHQEERTTAERYLEAVDMETEVEVVNRKMSKDNGGGDPTIVRK